ncbi:MAG: hypothetical protein ACPH4K_08760, partial [Flavobacteriaceae bacterium]
MYRRWPTTATSTRRGRANPAGEPRDWTGRRPTLPLNNQFRYLSSLGDNSDRDIGIYIPDLLYKFKNINFGLRGFLINRLEGIDKISMTKPFVGPAIIMKEEKLMTMLTLLPDINQNSDDYLLMALFIFKL